MYKTSKVMEKFFVVSENLAPTISGDAAEAIGLVRRIYGITEDKEKEDWINKLPEVFQGRGVIEGVKVKLQLKRDYVPVISPCRRIPVSQEDAAKKELDRMLAEGIITKQNEPSEFVSYIVIVPKLNGKIRLCLDP